MWTVTRKEVQLKVIDGKAVKQLITSDTGNRHTILYNALEDSTSRNMTAPSNVVYVVEPSDD